MENNVTLQQLRNLKTQELIFKILSVLIFSMLFLLFLFKSKESSRLEQAQQELMETKESLEAVNKDLKTKQMDLSNLLAEIEPSIKQTDSLLASKISKAIEKKTYVIIHVRNGEQANKIVLDIKNDITSMLKLSVKTREIDKKDFKNKVVYFEESNSNRAEKLKQTLEKTFLDNGYPIKFELKKPNITAPEGLIEVWLDLPPEAQKTKLIFPHNPGR